VKRFARESVSLQFKLAWILALALIGLCIMGLLVVIVAAHRRFSLHQDGFEFSSVSNAR